MKKRFASAVLLIFFSCLAISLLSRDNRSEEEFSLSDLDGPVKVINPDVQVCGAFAKNYIFTHY